MANRDKNAIASAVRNLLISQHNFHADGDYVRKEISNNFCIGFFHDNNNTLCICITHQEGKDFSPRQRSKIIEILSREEFQSCYSEPDDGKSTDNRSEIWAPLRIDNFNGYENEEIAEWIIKLFIHFINTAELLMLT